MKYGEPLSIGKVHSSIDTFLQVCRGVEDTVSAIPHDAESAHDE